MTVIVLLALSDKGAPSFDHELAARLAALGAPAFACTPDHFPGLMATAIEKRDVRRWAAEQGIALERPKGPDDQIEQFGSPRRPIYRVARKYAGTFAWHAADSGIPQTRGGTR